MFLFFISTFLWNFCHLFSVLFYQWNTSINDSLHFLGCFFLGIISWKGALLFNGEGGMSHGRGGASALMEGGFKKNNGMGDAPTPTPNYGKPWEQWHLWMPWCHPYIYHCKSKRRHKLWLENCPCLGSKCKKIPNQCQVFQSTSSSFKMEHKFNINLK